MTRMHAKPLHRPAAILLLSLGALLPLRANDYTAEIANGGLRARHETRVAMKSEKLFISETRIRVEYEYLNDTDQDVETEVAFPWPRYGWSPAEQTYDPSMLRFSVQVDGREVLHETQIRAFDPKGHDITEALARRGLDIPLFGYMDGGASWPEVHGRSYQVLALPLKDRQELARLGAIDSADEDAQPTWQVEITHHWTQRFPAHRIVRIAHEYAPIGGGASTMDLASMAHPGPDTRDPGCPDAALQAVVERRNVEYRKQRGSAYMGDPGWSWVRYILTTANTWKGPIGDFTLIVERRPGELVNFCWDGPVEKVGPDSFRATAKDFRPTKELTLYFQAKP